MNKQALDKVCKDVYQQFTTVDAVKPKVTRQGDNKYLLVFSGSGETPDGRTIKQNIRVVVTDDGRIIKTSMSR